MPFPFPHLQFKGSQWGALPSVCTQVTVWHPGVAVGRRLEMFTWLSAHWISELNMGRPLWSLHKLWGLGCGKEGWERVHSLQQCFPIICHPNTWLHFSDSLNKIQTWWIYAIVVSKNAILFCFDSKSLSISAVWSSLLLLHIIALCSRPNSSAPEIRCPWLLALICVMPYWEVIARYDKAKFALQEYGFRCNNLRQEKKVHGKTTTTVQYVPVLRVVKVRLQWW